VEFLLRLKKEFGEEDEESVKVAKLKRVEQGERTMQKFRKAARESRYQRGVLVEEFKRRMNGVI